MVLLIAAIALAVRDDESSAQMSPAAQPARREQDAANAAIRLATAFGGEAMFGQESRRELIESSVHPAELGRMLEESATDYDQLARKIGLMNMASRQPTPSSSRAPRP
ncbi:hypothetical protein ACIHFC_37045 [Streptomyces sp. NPDC052013]|uniref:hypothetical protein n=1 Tax=Streptomyces sp. NPDC052013 TaxID=3365679 RepID=UPI0037CE7F28